MRRTSGARSVATIRATRSRRTPRAGVAAMAPTLSGQPDIDRYRVADGPRHRRPLDGVGEQSRQGLALRARVELDAYPDGREAHRFGTGIAGAPHGGDVEVSFELQLERGQFDTLRDGVRVDPDGNAGAKRREDRLGRIRRSIVAEEGRRLVDDVGWQVAHEVELAEPRLGDGAALDRAHLGGIRPALGDQGVEAVLVDWSKLRSHGVDSSRVCVGTADVKGSPGCT